MLMSATNQQAISESGFWQAVSILLRNHHGINRKLSGVKTVKAFVVKYTDLRLCPIGEKSDYDDLKDLIRECRIEEAEECTEQTVYNALQPERTEQHELKYLLISKLFYKKHISATSNIIQIIDFSKKFVHFSPFGSSDDNSDVKYNFDICLQNGLLQANVREIGEQQTKEKTHKWIEYVLKPKLFKWSQSTDQNGKGNVNNKSLSLIDIESYTNLYSILKEKYGRDMVERWTETTDPLKFVYEDVAIATYLILLWKSLADPPSKFIDMGCGNGLLVHILNSEGFHGYGVDIRKRKIWDLYPESTILKEHTIIPTEYNTYKEVDWIIGNHSDELSPWIPVIATMCSFKTKFFLLPCCAYEFSGKKFQRRRSSVSVYNDFLEYVQAISDKCRFKIDIDRLKIPSTKRVAIIGSSRLYTESDYSIVCQDLQNYIKNEMEKTNCSEVLLRDKVELVRNCTKIDKEIISKLVVNIMLFILKDDEHDKQMTKWRTGRTITLRELAGHLSKTDLKNIKSECGGLKTLIKNKHEIFEILGDKVKLRYPRKAEERSKAFQYKRRQCFFYFYHPDGCPLDSSQCTFLHNEVKT